MIEVLLTLAGGVLLKMLWAPTIVIMLVSVVAAPALRFLPIREELRQPIQRFFRIAGMVSTALVLLAFVFMFGSLWMAARSNGAQA